MTTRRDFLKSSSLISLAPLVPGFVNQLARTTRAEADQSILVIVELSGGNDGLNTVIPFADEVYEKYRPTLKLTTDEPHKLTDSVALHRAMSGARQMFDGGELAIVQSVGYPNPNRSHFESMAIWHTADLAGQRPGQAGWIGEALDSARDPRRFDIDGYFAGAESLPGAMVSRRAQIAAVSRFVDMQIDPLVKPLESSPSTTDISTFVYRQQAAALATSNKLKSFSGGSKPESAYPDTELAERLKLVSQLIRSGSAARVYYAVQGGYDTHSAQRYAHARLLGEFSAAVKSFFDDLRRDQLVDRVVLMAFSEFGRRVQENDSQGTDHGTAGSVFLAGPSVRGGLHGAVPDLSNLVDGDLQTQFDFRQVYATLLDRWLSIPSAPILHESFKHLPLL